MGVTETNFRVKQGVTGTGDWKVYDVGGSRTMRSAWVPFFDDGASTRIFSLDACLICFVSERHPLPGPCLRV